VKTMLPSPETDAVLAPDGRFGRYTIVRMLGMGGMGVVYEAQHTDLRKRVALKVMKGELAANAEARARFLREGEAAARIRHPHVVDVNDVGTHEGRPFLVMEYLEGEDLGALLARERVLAVERTLDLLLPVAAGIAAGHSRGVVHRDLKPQNIFLSRGWDGEVVPKILDFGVSKLLDPGAGAASVTRAGALYGTLNYMSPEQAHGAIDVGAATDQYALGTILYECWTGQRAFPGEQALDVLRRVAAGEIAPPRALRPDLPPTLEAIVVRALRREPGERHESVIALGRALMPFASLRASVLWSGTFGVTPPPSSRPGEPAPVGRAPETPWPARGGDTVALPQPPSAPPTAARPAARARRLWPLAGLAILGVGVAVWLGLRQPEPSVPVPVYVTPPPPAATPAPAPAPAAPAAEVVAAPPPAEVAPADPPPIPEARRAPSRPKAAHRRVQRTSNRAPVVD